MKILKIYIIFQDVSNKIAKLIVAVEILQQDADHTTLKETCVAGLVVERQ